MGDVIEFKQPKQDAWPVVDESTTIVEKLEMTSEMKAEFEELGYTFDNEGDAA